MRVPDEILSAVVFVGRVVQKGSNQDRVLLGTAFIVSVPSEKDKDSGYLYVVTAKHVANSLSLGGTWFIRTNAKNGGILNVDVLGPAKWLSHPTEPNCVDAAVICPDIPWDRLRFLAIPVSMFATNDVKG